MSKIERRFLGTDVAAPVFESRRGTPTGTRTLSGMAAIFDREIELMPRVFERIAPGAFSDVLGDPDTRLLLNHDSNHVLARVGAGSLSLRENAEGLHFTARVGEGGVGDNALAMIADQRIDQMSFGFIIGAESFEQRNRGDVVRVIEKIEKLVDVSAVTFPAYSETTVAIADSGRSGHVPHDETLDCELELQRMRRLIDRPAKRVSAGLTPAQLALLREPAVRPRPSNRAPNSIRADRCPGPVCP